MAYLFLIVFLGQKRFVFLSFYLFFLYLALLYHGTTPWQMFESVHCNCQQTEMLLKMLIASSLGFEGPGL